MKINFLIVLISAVISGKANVLTVSNNPANPAQYSSYGAAEAAAASGDTIYLCSTISSYGTITITKSIVLLGTGHKPSTQLGQSSVIDYLHVTNGLNNVSVSGLKINYNINGTQGNSLINFSIRNCNIAGLIYLKSNSTGIEISGNVFSSATDNLNAGGICAFQLNLNNVLIQNNIFSGRLAYLSGNSIVLSNNIFLYPGDLFFANGCAAPYMKNCYLKNNIFYNAHPINGLELVSCTLENNLSYTTGNPFPVMPGTSNINNTNPLFTTYSGGTFSYTDNYSFQVASPAISAGTDGSNLGIFGGSYPTTLTGEPRGIPVIRKMEILNTNTEQNDNVNVKVRSTKAR